MRLVKNKKKTYRVQNWILLLIHPLQTHLLQKQVLLQMNPPQKQILFQIN